MDYLFVEIEVWVRDRHGRKMKKKKQKNWEQKFKRMANRNDNGFHYLKNKGFFKCASAME